MSGETEIDWLPVAKRAAHALEAKRADEAARRAERERERREEEALLDADTMAWVKQHPWLKRHLPDVDWVLVDRRFPQVTAVIHPEREPSLKLVVTSGHDEHVLLVRDGAEGTWLVGARHCRDLAELGQYLYDRSRAASQSAVTE